MSNRRCVDAPALSRSHDMTKPTKGAAKRAVPKQIIASGEQNTIETIQELNDRFRHSLRGGRVVVTAGVHALGPERLHTILTQVTSFNSFTAENDPHGEHDFGAFDDGSERLFWKIDYYNQTLTAGSPDPADPRHTCRVLTIMLASEY
jgi:hypothetical protein